MKTIITIAILMIAAITNPKTIDHQIKVKSEISRAIHTKNLKEGNDVGILGEVIIKLAIDKEVETSISSDNYILFSLTKVIDKSGSRVVGIGVFTKVFLFTNINKD